MAETRCRPTVLHYCQHSVGLGHLVRSLAFARALARDFRVVVVSGGRVPDELDLPGDVELVRLPAIGAADGGGSELVSLESGVDLASVWARRRAILLGLLDELRPAALVIELFPLGRRKFAGELLPLLDASRAMARPPVVVCSVRDILVSNGLEQQGRDDEAVDRLNRYFDAVIVHADPTFVRLEATFSPSVPLEVPVYHSGFVVDDVERPVVARAQSREVLVSAGGGKVGAALLGTAALAQRHHLHELGWTMRIVTGPFLGDDDVRALRAHAAACSSLRVERFVPDLCEQMARSAVTVSQCGYNTALDVMRAGVPSLVVPFDEGRETEQAERARRMADAGLVRVLPMKDLSERSLADAITNLDSFEPKSAAIDWHGARASAEFVGELLRLRQSVRSSALVR